MAINRFQSFDIMTIHRSEIKNAPYNPRFIVDGAKKRLKKGLRKFGLVETLVWNKRTGNLVSGHQRLSIIDELEKTQDYEITVSVIDVSEKDEMSLNVQLNNPSMMGEFDIDSLVSMAESGADIESFGFSESDLDILFGDSDLADKFTDSSQIEEDKQTLKDIKKDRSEFVEKLKEESSADYYFTVICENSAQREALFRQMGVPFSEDFISAELLERLKN